MRRPDRPEETRPTDGAVDLDGIDPVEVVALDERNRPSLVTGIVRHPPEAASFVTMFPDFQIKESRVLLLGPLRARRLARALDRMAEVIDAESGHAHESVPRQRASKSTSAAEEMVRILVAHRLDVWEVLGALAVLVARNCIEMDERGLHPILNDWVAAVVGTHRELREEALKAQEPAGSA